MFRVQCGKCRGWLGRAPGIPATVESSAAVFPGERAARTGALAAGWAPDYTLAPGSGVLLCPDCKTNPLGIELPPQCPNCLHVHRLGTLCGNLTAGYACKCMNQEKRD